LLRVLQERQIERVGGTEPVALDVRVIAATNRNLETLMKDHLFREDLYYRLNVIQLDMPPLRERKSDVGVLWSKFVQRYAKREGLLQPETAPEALHNLYAYDWPGNVRELENVAERAVILSRGQVIQPTHLPGSVRVQASAVEGTGVRIPGSTLAEIEKVAILKTLAAVNGSSSRAAEILGISARKIQYRLREWRSRATAQGELHGRPWDWEREHHTERASGDGEAASSGSESPAASAPPPADLR
jgi:two-component system NtrC family response regulator/two-component system response regulator HydG